MQKQRFRALRHKIRGESHYVKTYDSTGKLQVSIVITGQRIKILNPEEVVISL